MAGQRNPKIHLSFIEILPVVINQLFRTISTVNSHSVELSRSLLPSTKKSSRGDILCSLQSQKVDTGNGQIENDTPGNLPAGPTLFPFLFRRTPETIRPFMRLVEH